MPVIEKWGRGKPSKEKIEQTAQQIRDGWTLPEGMKIPASVQALLDPPVEMASQFVLQAEVDRGEDGTNPLRHDEPPKPRQTQKQKDRDERTAYVVRVRTSEDYAPITDPRTILSITQNYRDHQKWLAMDKVGEGALATAEKHYLRIPEELRNNKS